MPGGFTLMLRSRRLVVQHDCNFKMTIKPPLPYYTIEVAKPASAKPREYFITQGAAVQAARERAMETNQEYQVFFNARNKEKKQICDM